MSISIKTPQEIEKMRIAGRLAGEVLDYIAPFVKVGVTTDELDKLCHDYMVNVQGCIPAPLNYAPHGHTPYPKSICTSINHQVCHGVPSDKKLKNGDIVNLDITTIKDGYHGDTSRMYYVGEPSIQAKRLCETTYQAMWRGIRMVKAGAHLGDIGHAIQTFVEGMGYSVVREFCGHGIGSQLPRRAAGAALRQGRHRPQTRSRHDLHHRAHGQRGQGRHQATGRRLDRGDQGPQPVGAIRAHRAGHGNRLRSVDTLRRGSTHPCLTLDPRRCP